MQNYIVSIGELDPVEDAHLLPKDEQTIIGERRIRAVLTTPESEVAFLSSPYNPSDRQLHAEALVALLCSISDRVMDMEFPVPAELPPPELRIVQ